jgi:flagellar basal-body rod modification protein FlgD
MEIIPSDFQIQNRMAARDAIENPEEGQLGRNAFLQLLLTQLENQDPLSPMQDHEFVAQLATFSSLEQLEGINQGMQTNLLMNQSVNNSLATTLIGKEVLASGNSVALGESGSVNFQLDLQADADVTIMIRDSEGNLVRQIDRGALTAGTSQIDWDGMTDSGSRADAGAYTVDIVATDKNGLPVIADTKMRARVDGIRFIDGAGYLLVGGKEIPLASVVEVLAGQG